VKHVEAVLENPFVQLVIIIIGVMIFAKIAGVFKKISLSAGFKKYAIILTVLILIGLNVGGSMFKIPTSEDKVAEWEKLTTTQQQHNVAMNNYLIVAGVVTVIVFTLALMSETKEES
jgi:hydrogenase maturation factor